MRWFFYARGGWIQIGRILLILTREPPLFSERMGYRKHFHIGFGWRARLELAKEKS